MSDPATIEHKRLLRTELPGPRSLELHARRQRVVTSGVSSTFEAYIERGSGAILVDVDGNQLIDLGSGIAVASIGHGHPAVAAAVARQSEAFNHTCFMVSPYEGYVGVAEALDELTPGSHQKASALFNSGAEAVENAVKVARLATGRQAIVVFDHAYHGLQGSLRPLCP
jgi:4-aminobutyrate aminotransferase / (S)-3-amino-2-methylpropionate transaminase / 5-aminovalerate transaminase